MIHFILLFSRQGKLRLQKWYEARDSKDKKKIIRDLTGLILQRKPKMCNFIEYKDMCIVYKRYASLFFCFAVDKTDNELGVLEVIHRYVEVLDKYFGSVCELDIIFNFEKAYFILDELLLGGEMQVGSFRNVQNAIRIQFKLFQETSKKAVLNQIEQADKFQEEEIVELALKDIGLI